MPESAPRTSHLRVLVLSWNFPTSAAPQRGLWVERMCDALAPEGTTEVIVPTPWIPPFLPWRRFARFRDVPVHEIRRGLVIHAPRVPGSVEYLTHSLDAGLARNRIVRLARLRHAESPFDIVHAHFIYPDGVVASSIGQALGIPVITTEHAFWTPWLVTNGRQRRSVHHALADIRLVTCVSEFLRADVDRFLDGRVPTAVLPNVVDDSVFSMAAEPYDPDEVLFVGLVRQVKRPDVLLRGFAMARQRRPALRLRILSSAAFHAYARDRRAMDDLIVELGLQDAVTVVRGASPAGVAAAMRRAAVVAVTSDRRETFCSVAAESLACGTPLVVTRCGGPEEFVTQDDGVLVPTGDPAAVAAGLLQVLEERHRFDSATMRSRILARFGSGAWRQRAMTIYRGVIDGKPGPG